MRFDKLAPNTLCDGEDPPAHKIEYEDAPCSCGKVPTEIERFDLLMCHHDGNPIYKNTTRCKVCKDPTMIMRKYEK